MKDLRWLAFFSLCAPPLGCTSQAIDSPDEGPSTPSAQIESFTPELIYTPRARVELSATALAFNPTIAGELWVALRQFPSGLPCTKTDETGCAALPGVMAVVSDATSQEPSAELKEDGNSWHFMRRPAAMAWGEDALFASCGEALTDNYEDDDIPYAGPVLWSSDPTIFGVEPLPEQNGTHLDMLHETPYCMGIAHESGNAYWAFNGLAGSLDRVDFHAPHQIGGENHSDGEVHRYVTGQLLRVAEVPSHVVYDKARSLVYVVDSGHARVLSVDPSTAVARGEIKEYELLASSGAMEGATASELVPSGLQLPSGIALDSDVLYVTDNATSRIHTFDVTGKALRTFDTGLPAGSLAGITVGPDGSLYLTDLSNGSVYRVDIPAR